MTTRIGIIGGGVSGLAAAYRLQRRVPKADVTLFEKDARLGGKIQTEHIEDFLVEAAADCFLTRKPRGVELCEELGIAGRLIGRRPEHARTFVRFGGALHDLPEGLTGLVPANLDALAASSLLSDEGRADARREPEVAPSPHDKEESLAAFMTRRFGREVYERLIEPLMSGIYGGDGEALSIDATFPHLRELERAHGSLTKALATTTRRDDAMPAFASFPRGMGELIDVLASRIDGTRIRTSTVVRAIERDGDGFTVTIDGGRHEHFDALIVTTPAHVTAELLRALDAELAEVHDAIPYGSSATVSLAFAAGDMTDRVSGYGYLVPRIENSDVLACTFTSNKWQGRAPDGFALARVYLGRIGGEALLERRDAALVEMSRDELRDTIGVTAEPLWSRVYRWPRSMPQYTLGHNERVARIDERLMGHPGLFVAGTAYRGVGIPDAIAAGEEAAESAAAFVATNAEERKRA